ncbi:unnamed protein product, partial [Vitis vinifera]
MLQFSPFSVDAESGLPYFFLTLSQSWHLSGASQNLNLIWTANHVIQWKRCWNQIPTFSSSIISSKITSLFFLSKMGENSSMLVFSLLYLKASQFQPESHI